MIARPKPSKFENDENPSSIRLGYSLRPKTKIGFQSAPIVDQESIRISDELPILTFAPTGGGKGIGSIIPTLIEVNRSMIVLDPKGENYAVTADRRRAMGHQVFALDPFHVMTKKSDALNPFDLLDLPGVSVEAESVMLAETIGHDFQSKKEAFWDQHALGVLSGLIALSKIRPYAASLATVRDHLVGEDPIRKIAEALDYLTDKDLKETLSYRELSAFINQSERETRPSVLASAGAYVKIFNTDEIIKVVQKSTFKIKDLVDNKPMTIYLIFDVNKLHSHRALLRLWFATAISAMHTRRSRPCESTLLLIDECSQLGTFDLLKSTVTMSRGFGIQPWLFFQSLHQMKENYGDASRTILDNAGAVQAFGFANRFSASDWGDFFGRSPDQLLRLPPEHQLLYIKGRGTIESKRLNYLRDPQYQGLYKPNPYFNPPPPSKAERN
jgi:type IV secretion system protein VirD4